MHLDMADAVIEFVWGLCEAIIGKREPSAKGES